MIIINLFTMMIVCVVVMVGMRLRMMKIMLMLIMKIMVFEVALTKRHYGDDSDVDTDDWFGSLGGKDDDKTVEDIFYLDNYDDDDDDDDDDGDGENDDDDDDVPAISTKVSSSARLFSMSVSVELAWVRLDSTVVTPRSLSSSPILTIREIRVLWACHVIWQNHMHKENVGLGIENDRG